MMLDGSINWPTELPVASEKGFDISSRKEDIYQWVRQVRGGVLAGTFTIERHLSGAIIFFFLGDRVMRQDIQSAFDESILAPMTFERRINVVSSIAPFVIDAGVAKRLCSDLNELKTLRNSMAHRPFWLQPEINDAGRVYNLVPFITRGKAPLALTSAFVEETNAKMLATIATSKELMEAAARKGKAEGLA